jgi:hypothetical protein
MIASKETGLPALWRGVGCAGGAGPLLGALRCGSLWCVFSMRGWSIFIGGLPTPSFISNTRLILIPIF